MPSALRRPAVAVAAGCLVLGCSVMPVSVSGIIHTMVFGGLGCFLGGVGVGAVSVAVARQRLRQLLFGI